MFLETGEGIIIISDFHLAAGYDPRTQTFDRKEDFFSDTAFAHFLDDLSRRAAAEQCTWRLLILGDLFDFLHVTLEPPRGAARPSDTSSGTALAKLERMAAGHPELFDALGRFLAAGFSLDLVPGNHDIELLHRPVQERLIELLARFSGQPDVHERIRFFPWIYYVPGVLYAEHGQQHHDINAFKMLLRFAQLQPSVPIELPLGSDFDNYLYTLIDHIDPLAQNIKPLLSYLRRAYRARPAAAFTALRQHFYFIKVLLSQIAKLSVPQSAAERAAYDRDVLQPYASEIGLGYETVVAVDRLSSVTSLSILKRLLHKVLRRSREGSEPSDYLHRAALEIHRLLKSAHLNVPYYVFGHTHTAARYALSQDAAATYLNTGTWTSLAPSARAEHSARLTFVEVVRDTTTAAPSARLLLWDDAARQSQPLT